MRDSSSALCTNATSLFIKHQDIAACQTLCLFLRINKLAGPQLEMVFPSKWKQYSLADRAFDWESRHQDLITAFFAELLCDLWGSHSAGFASIPLHPLPLLSTQ